jgi:hypothetical protein
MISYSSQILLRIIDYDNNTYRNHTNNNRYLMSCQSPYLRLHDLCAYELIITYINIRYSYLSIEEI